MRFHRVFALICAALISFSAHAQLYESVQIAAPQADETVHDNNGDVAVTVVVSPGLRAGDQLILLVDGQVAGKAANPVFKLSDVERGSHTLEVRVEAADGSVLATSPLTTFYMWRASSLFPTRRAP